MVNFHYLTFMLHSHAIGHCISAPPYPTLYGWSLLVTSASLRL